MSRCNHWSPLVERFHKRLSNWKSMSLSIGGRFTLIKLVFGSLGVYYFSSFKAPKKIINKLESIRRSFFWGGSMDENTVSWIAWDKVLSPRNHGGLGIAPISHLIDIGSANPNSPPGLLFNWAWRREPRTFPELEELTNLMSLFQIRLRININTWRVLNGRLATRSNLDRRGIDHDSVWCPLCDDDIEMKEHLFIHCKVVKEIWLDVLKWWRIPNVSVVTLLDLVHLADRTSLEDKFSSVFDAIV
ncbi:RNA-directed DNA polymerase, eukaryota, reverse transcriptase zinc-binding domain protein [Tanacetum coccineum]